MGELAEKRIIPATAEEARSIGSLVYFTGKACPSGHVSNRYTDSYSCVQCKKSDNAKQRNKVWYKENGKVRNSRKRADRKSNPKKHAKWQSEYARRNPARIMLISAKSRAKQRGIEFNLKLADIVIPDVCPVLGIKLQLGNYLTSSPSLDRIDNSRGYVVGNVAVISNRANLIKRDASLEELERIVTYMRNHKQF